MAEQSYELMHKDDVVASLQLDDLSGAILKVTPGTNPELLPLGGSQGAVKVSHPRRVCSCGTLVSVCPTTTGSDRKRAT